MNSSIESQRTLIDLQQVDSAIDRLLHRRANLPEDARLRELGVQQAAVEQLWAERDGVLVQVGIAQTRLEDEVAMVSSKAVSEEARAASGRVSSPKELTAITEEVAALKRRQASLEDDLLERMEEREQLESEIAELERRRAALRAEVDEVTKARDAALAEVEAALEVEGRKRAELLPGVEEPLRKLYDEVRSRLGGVGAAALVGDTCQGCRVAVSPVELTAIRKRPPEEIKRCENCRRILVVA